MPRKTYLVSACLLGLSTCYHGGHNRSAALQYLCRRCRVIPLCPEQLGGLPTPREPAEIRGGDGYAVLREKARVIDKTGKDVTLQFLRGAAAALRLARLYRVKGAVLKSGSPSCGAGRIYDGSFSGRYRTGDGITAALLKLHGIPVCNENSLTPVKSVSRRRLSSGKRRRPR